MLKIKNSEIKSITVAFLCLSIGAFLLFSFYLVFFLKLYPQFQSFADRQASKPVSPLVMKGRSFVPIGLVPTEFVGDGHRVNVYVDNQAMLVSPQYVDVADFPFVRFDVEGVHRDMAVKLIWRRLDMPTGDYHEAFLHTSGDGVHWHNMAKYPEWSGTLVEIGIGGVGRSQDERFVLMRDKPFLLRTVELMPFSRMGVVKTIWDEWTYFEGWSHTSVNFHAATPRSPIISPNIFFLSLFGSSVLLLSISAISTATLFQKSNAHQVFTKILLREALLALFFFTWLFPATLHFNFLHQQARDTSILFYAKSIPERAANSRLRCSLTEQARHRKTPVRKANNFCQTEEPLPYF